MKTFSTYDDGRAAVHELTSTQTLIASLINNDSGQSQTEAIKELTACIETYEQILVKFKNNEDNYVS